MPDVSSLLFRRAYKCYAHLFVTTILLLLLSTSFSSAQGYRMRGIPVTPSIETYVNTTDITFNQVLDTLRSYGNADDDTAEGGLQTKLKIFNSFWKDRVYKNDASGHNMFDQYAKALRTTALAGTSGCGTDLAKWECIGPDGLPTQQAGYVTCVWADTGVDSNFILAGTEYGGLFRTTNGGIEWENITDNSSFVSGNMRVTSIAVNPLNKNTIYVGTTGAGILKSFNRGVSWQQEFIGYGGWGDSIQNTPYVFFRPDSIRVYAFCGDSVFTRSNASGASFTWQNITPSGNCHLIGWGDLVFVPGNQNHFFISNGAVTGADPTYQGIYESTDSVPSPGSWNEITASFSHTVGGTLINYDQWAMMRLSMPDADTLFFSALAYTQNTSIYKYSLSGTAITEVHDNMPKDSYDQAKGKGQFVVSQATTSNNAYRRNMYFGWDKPYHSWDNGVTFHEIGRYDADPTHGDVRGFYLQKATNSLRGIDDRLFVATDGGVSKKPSGYDDSLYASYSTIDISGKGLACGEFHGFATSEAGGIGIGGMQHDGILGYEPSLTPKWQSLINADAYNTAFDLSNPTKAYTWTGYNAFDLDSTRPGLGRELKYLGRISPSPFDNPSFNIIPTETDLLGKVYSVQQRFWIKPLFSTFSTTSLLGFPDSATSSFEGRKLAFDPYASTYKGYVLYAHYTARVKLLYREPPSAATETVNPVQSPYLSSLWEFPITDITTNPMNTEQVWVSQGNFTQRTFPTMTRYRVQYSPNHGSTWIDISKGLPQQIPATCIIYDEYSNCLYCATDVGIYRCNFNTYSSGSTTTDADGRRYNTSVEWECFNNGRVLDKNFPKVWVKMLQINRCQNKLYATTYGRSIWTTSLPDNSDGSLNPLMIGSNTTWNGEKWMRSSIRVKAGATLTLSYATIHMPANAVIIVEPGAQLITSNAKITNSCAGCMWGGIQGWGRDWLPQTAANQAYVRLGIGTTVEHAKVAFSNYRPDSVNSTGGILLGVYCTFLNNANSVTFKEYHRYLTSPAGALAPNVSELGNCTFLIDDNYKGYYLSLPPNRHVSLEGVEGIAFRGCRFINRCSQYVGVGDGIYSVNSGFTVVPYPIFPIPGIGTPPPVRSTFKGLTNGIAVSEVGTWSSPQAVSVEQADFDSISVGVNVSVQRTVSISRCNFKIGRGRRMPFINADGSPLGCGRNIGVVTQSAWIFRIEENTFTGQSNSFGTSPWYNFGVLTVNAGNHTNRIYRSSFSDLTYGVYAMGDNSPHYPALPGFGVQVSCNDFSNNTNDIYSHGSNPGQGIGVIQRGPTAWGDADAGNTFSGSVKNLVNDNPTVHLDYMLYYTSSITTSGWVMVFTTTIPETCPSTLPPPVGSSSPSYMTAPPTALDESALTTIKSDFYAAKARFDGAMNDYEKTIDAGNTDSVLYVIDTSANATRLISTLTAISPYLSAAALKKAAEVIGLSNYSDMMDILALNPEVIRDYDLLTDISGTMSMSQNDFDDLWAGATGASGRDTLENNIRTARASMEENASIILMALKSPTDTNVSVSDTTYTGICMDTNSVYYLTDTNSFYRGLDSIDQWLHNIGTLQSTYERIGLKYFNKNYLGANSLFNSIVTDDMTADELAEYNTYDTLWNVAYTAAQDGKRIFDLTEDEIETLDTTGYATYTTNAAKVRIWDVRIIRDRVAPCDMFVPLGSKPHIHETPPSKKREKFSQLKVYPNPSNGIVTFEYNIPDGGRRENTITISVSNILGEKVMEQKAIGNSGKLLWNSQNMASGVYIYHASSDQGIISNGKITLIK